MTKTVDLSIVVLMRASLALADRATQKLTDREELAQRWIGAAA